MLAIFLMTLSLFRASVSTGANWTAEEEKIICDMAAPNDFKFCKSSGGAGDNCKLFAEKLKGTDPKCSEAQTCTFVKEGQPAFVTCNSIKPGYDILRNCVHNVGIANPNPNTNLEDVESLMNEDGKEGTGVYEKTSLANRLVCSTSDQSVVNCESPELRDDLIKNFHPEKRLGNLMGGICFSTYGVKEDASTYNISRCVFGATFFNDKSGKREKCRFHLFNHGSDPKVVAMTYWGDEHVVKSSVKIV